VEDTGSTRFVIFFNAELPMVEAWRRKTDWIWDDVSVLADPEATVYKALGTNRPRTYAGLMRGSVGALAKSAREGKFARITSADMLRLGADVAVRPDGSIAKLHLASSPDDRIAVSELQAALT
jgi:hypothetical protein